MAQRVHNPAALTSGFKNFGVVLAASHLEFPSSRGRKRKCTFVRKVTSTTAAPLRHGFRLFRQLPVNFAGQGTFGLGEPFHNRASLNELVPVQRLERVTALKSPAHKRPGRLPVNKIVAGHFRFLLEALADGFSARGTAA
jgi:hypothetical protein